MPVSNQKLVSCAVMVPRGVASWRSFVWASQSGERVLGRARQGGGPRRASDSDSESSADGSADDAGASAAARRAATAAPQVRLAPVQLPSSHSRARSCFASHNLGLAASVCVTSAMQSKAVVWLTVPAECAAHTMHRAQQLTRRPWAPQMASPRTTWMSSSERLRQRSMLPAMMAPAAATPQTGVL